MVDLGTDPFNDTRLANNKTIDDEHGHPLEYYRAIFCLIFFIVGVPGNLLTILAILRTPKLRNATSAFIVNLCVSDALYCGFKMPMTAATFLDWIPHGDTLCMALLMITYSNAGVSLLTIVAITINRYVLIVHFVQYRRACSKLSVGIYVALLWIIPFVLMAPTAAGKWGAFYLEPGTGDCYVREVNGQSSNTFVFGFTFGVPTVVLTYCYSRIFYFVKSNQRRLRCTGGVTIQQEEPKVSWFSNCFRSLKEETMSFLRDESERKLSKELRLLRLILVLFLSYVICYFPLSLLYLVGKQRVWPVLSEIGDICVYLSSCINPIIYDAVSKEYRQAYKNLCVRSVAEDVSGDGTEDTTR